MLLLALGLGISGVAAQAGDAVALCQKLVGPICNGSVIWDQTGCENFWSGLGTTAGQQTDTSGDTIGCRNYYANRANTTANKFWCQYAGPTGGGLCGNPIVTGCDAIGYLCSENATACQTENAGVAAVWGSNQGAAAAGENSLECRVYHAAVGNTGGANGYHCNHTKSGGPCAAAVPTNADHYCSLINGACTGANAQYNNHAQCLGSFAAFPDSAVTSNAGNANTRGNRQYHAQAAVALGVSAHCQHAGPSGANVVGNVHDSWRFLAGIPGCAPVPGNLNATINTAFSAWARADLEAVVPAGAGNGSAYNVGESGNTALCRLYHLTVATQDPTHCTHGDLLGTDVSGTPMAVTSVCGSFNANACGIIQRACGTTAFADTAACTTAIGAYTANITRMGMPGDQTMDTFACKMYHAGVAMAAKAGGTAAAAQVTSNCNKIKGMGGCPAPPPTPASSAVVASVGFIVALFPLLN